MTVCTGLAVVGTIASELFATAEKSFVKPFWGQLVWFLKRFVLLPILLMNTKAIIQCDRPKSGLGEVEGEVYGRKTAPGRMHNRSSREFETTFNIPADAKTFKFADSAAKDPAVRIFLMAGHWLRFCPADEI